MSDPMTEPHTLADFQRRADTVLSARAQAYINGGAADETTLADNRAAWSRLALVPRMLTGVEDADLSVTLLGRSRPHPVIVAPTAFAALAHDEAEVGIARAALRTQTTLCLSTLASTSPAALADAVPDVSRWFQLYVFSDAGITRELIATAEAHGYEAIVLTADRPVVGVRDRELRLVVRADPSDEIGGPEPTDFSGRIDPSLTWAGVQRLASETGLPVIVKGILSARDARLAVEHGAAGVVVSNHGGRVFRHTPAGPPPPHDAVGRRRARRDRRGGRRADRRARRRRHPPRHRHRQGARARGASGDGRAPAVVGTGRRWRRRRTPGA
jgi:4-hydroxymandelate oxidase